jgi:hypothetical protein
VPAGVIDQHAEPWFIHISNALALSDTLRDQGGC